jgi:hypothetical protein
MRQEVPGKIRARQKRGWSLAGETVEIANQMRLVVISALDSGIRPLPAVPFDCREYLLEAPHPREELG